VVLEEGTGDIATLLNKYEIGCVVKLSDKEKQNDFDNEVRKALDWLRDNSNAVRTNTRKFVDEFYTWQANVPAERKMYIQALHKAGRHDPKKEK
jgi:hypothetical protein